MIVIRGNRSPDDIGQAFCHTQHTACGCVGHTGLWCMAQCSGDALLATVVESHHTTVRQWQLYLTLRLLAGYLARHRAVNLVGQPVLAGHSFELQHAVEVFINVVGRVGHVLVVVLDSLVDHHGLGRVAEHLCHVEVERLHAVALHKAEVGVACGLADDIQRGTLALSDEQSHALLALVGDDLLGRECLVADRQLGHVDLAAAVLDKLREAVEVAGGAVVMDGNYRVDIFFHEGAHEVVGTLLHLRVGTLHGVELDAIAIASGIDRRDATTTETDAIVVTADDDDVVACLWLFLQTVALLAVADATGEHDHLVIAIDLTGLLAFDGLAVGRCGCVACGALIFKGQQRTRDEWLTELITEVRGSVGCFDENLLRRLIKPWTRSDLVFPVASGRVVVSLQTWIAGHVDRRTGDRP